MSAPRVLAVDQGSSATKGALFDGGRPAAVAEVAVGHRADGDRVEQDPLELAASVERVLAELAGGSPAAPDAVALACQRSTCLLWERSSGQPLTPAVSWQDRRAAAAAERLGPEVAAEVARRTGLRLSPHYAALKLAALLDDLPRGRERAAAGELVAGTLDTFLVHRLAGRPSTEPGQAGRTLLYGLDEGSWDPRLGALFGIPEAALPPVLPSAGRRGDWRGIPLVALAGDQQAALLGHGGWDGGVTAVHFGTGAFVLAATGRTSVRHPALLAAVLAATPRERRFQIEATVNSAGSAVDWAAAATGSDVESAGADELEPERLPLVLPAFAGAAAPWWRPEARAVVAGLDRGTSGADLLRATLAGVVQRVLDGVETMREAGVATPVLRASGKLTRLPALAGLLADLGQVPVEVGEEETGLSGVARLAACALGDEAALSARASTIRRRDPRWPEKRATAARARWRSFVERALDF